MRRRRRYDDDTDPADRWLVSYADFITLLFAFFVVMYALSLQGGQYQELSQSVGQAMGQKKKPSEPAKPGEPAQAEAPDAAQAAAGGDADGEPMPDADQMRAIAEQLSRRLSITLKQGASQVRRTAQGIQVEIEAGILFAPAEASLNPAAVQALRSVADVLRANPENLVQVGGHTDNIDIRSMQYPSNWELSAARASSVVRLFIEAGLDGKRLAAVGHADTLPLADNATPVGRQRNRRVEIRILPLTPTT